MIFLFFFSIFFQKGFSFTDSDSGYSTSQEEVAENLYSAVSQFFQLFPALQQHDFYICGESYAGKYVPSLAYKVHQMNQQSGTVPIPLVGISIGDGIMDPQTQTQGIAKQAYMFSMFDDNEKQAGLLYEASIGIFFIPQNIIFFISLKIFFFYDYVIDQAWLLIFSIFFSI